MAKLTVVKDLKKITDDGSERKETRVDIVKTKNGKMRLRLKREGRKAFMLSTVEWLNLWAKESKINKYLNVTVTYMD